MSVQSEAVQERVEAEPTWEIAHLFPNQGFWSEGDYLALETNRLVEFSHGTVEVLPMPTLKHQFVALYLYRLLHRFVNTKALGTVVAAPVQVQLWEGKFREPDVLFMFNQHRHRCYDRYWEGADLVIEVVSGGRKDRERDLVTKRAEYAQAGIPEYWIVDPEPETVTVLRLDGESYAVHGVFRRGDVATSVLLNGFTANVDEVFDANG